LPASEKSILYPPSQKSLTTHNYCDRIQPIDISHPAMDPTFKFPGSPGTPLFQVSPERVNQQRPSHSHTTSFDSSTSPTNQNRHTRESSIVQDKVAVFNSLAYQGKQLERKTNDAALKRAMLGREEAESEMRRYREETRGLRRQVEEGKERERRVGERLENVMVCRPTSFLP
jgi:hypothetical protein